jgi:KaiC/GvpD/RAD55 family RecA-like ATPase
LGVGVRLSTGLAGLDAQLGGGIPAGSLQLLLGEPMNAFELFGHHFAAAGTLKGISTIVSVQGSEADWKPGVAAVGGQAGRLVTVTLPTKGARGGWDLPSPKPTDRLVVEDCSFWLKRVGFDEGFTRLRALRDDLRRTGATALIMVLAPLHDVLETTRLRDLADGNLELGLDRKAFALYPFLKVTKMRGIPDAARFLLFRETDKGLFMESTRRVS